MSPALQVRMGHPAIAQGGTPPYDYNWSNGGVGTQLSQIGAGAYIITVTDSNGCPLVDTLVVNEPDPIEVEIDIINAICGTPSGSIELPLLAGQATYKSYGKAVRRRLF